MKQEHISTATVTINQPPSKVWEALTKPELIKQYLFGTEVVTDWRTGSPIKYRGVWQGKAYEDKGKVLELEPGKLLITTYWSSLSGEADLPQNYKTVLYDLASAEGGTRLTLTQDNNKS
jgi:uncharacterized protein YndB with AHSA1/START domain